MNAQRPPRASPGAEGDMSERMDVTKCTGALEDPAAKLPRARRPRDPWAKLPKSTILGLRCASCFRLFAYLDVEQGAAGRPVRGIDEAATELGWQLDTLKKHARHLAAAGVIRLDPQPSPGWGHTRMIVLHNPARERRSDRLTELSNVWVPRPVKRWRQPSRLDDLRARQANAEHDTPCVDPVDLPSEGRDARCVEQVARRATRKGATRHTDPPNAGRDVPRDVWSQSGLTTGLHEEMCQWCSDPADHWLTPPGLVVCGSHLGEAVNRYPETTVSPISHCPF